MIGSKGGSSMTVVSLTVLAASVAILVCCGMHGVNGEASVEVLGKPKMQASLVRVLRHPFEKVHAAWEGGEQDANFIKEDKSESWSGSTATITKTIYTRNPFPRVMRYVVKELGEEELVWGEEQVVDLARKSAKYLSVNKSIKGIGAAYRAATMRADPSNPGWTLFEQEGGVELSSRYPEAIRSSVEKFATSAFLSVCKDAADALEAKLDTAAGAEMVDEGEGGVGEQDCGVESSRQEESTPGDWRQFVLRTAYIYTPEAACEQERRLPCAARVRPVQLNNRGILGLVQWLWQHPTLVLGLLASQLAWSRSPLHANGVENVEWSEEDPSEAWGEEGLGEAEGHGRKLEKMVEFKVCAVHRQAMQHGKAQGMPLSRILGAAAAFVSH